MADLQRVSLDEIVVHFQQLEDPRSTINLRHPLVSVVVIALLAVLYIIDIVALWLLIPERGGAELE